MVSITTWFLLHPFWSLKASLSIHCKCMIQILKVFFFFQNLRMICSTHFLLQITDFWTACFEFLVSRTSSLGSSPSSPLRPSVQHRKTAEEKIKTMCGPSTQYATIEWDQPPTLQRQTANVQPMVMKVSRGYPIQALNKLPKHFFLLMHKLNFVPTTFPDLRRNCES